MTIFSCMSIVNGDMPYLAKFNKGHIKSDYEHILYIESETSLYDFYIWLIIWVILTDKIQEKIDQILNEISICKLKYTRLNWKWQCYSQLIDKKINKSENTYSLGHFTLVSLLILEMAHK